MDLNGIQISHFIPGRVRLKSLLIKGNLSLAQKIMELFSAIPGIREVEANHLTGSLLVVYDAKQLRTPDSTHQLEEALKFLAPNLDHDRVAWLLQRL
ncbi:HMA2 domain-containing protein [Desulfobacca acetoxidans]|uniref:Cation transporter n=1 Tax=Desulfobacca acetoxidans (strain ATCC 700848 / DSM 11109 / ASRB2) TaxID=880072 RepID=F2NC21_DESAR|nr:heavy-metal-associated domain-containing protein [Desulfobacca acetoxidans]AEB08098.1 hypothetical protein Desac_0205 [Desulfobacca acetoxidans DSM 11109]HAY22256.1 cation transporter [Desulfobacterales bacterium]